MITAFVAGDIWRSISSAAGRAVPYVGVNGVNVYAIHPCKCVVVAVVRLHDQHFVAGIAGGMEEEAQGFASGCGNYYVILADVYSKFAVVFLHQCMTQFKSAC